MENNEILNELAMAMGNIIENKVAEKTKCLEEKSNSQVGVATIIKKIKNRDFDDNDIRTILSEICGNYIEEMEQAVKSFVDANWPDVVKVEDIDEYWIFDNLNYSVIRDVARRYVNENL